MADELHEAFLRLFTRCEPELRAFGRSCLPRPQDVDEVMQEVSLVAWRKSGDLDDRGRFAPWACLIARYEILKYRPRCESLSRWDVCYPRVRLLVRVTNFGCDGSEAYPTTVHAESGRSKEQEASAGAKQIKMDAEINSA